MFSFRRIFLMFLAFCGFMIYDVIFQHIRNVEAPYLPLNQWWGDEVEPTDWSAYLANSSDVIGNRLMYADTTIDDLRLQLNRSLHFTEPLEGINFEYGFNSNYLQKLVKYWHDDYLPRWRQREVFLWQFNHFTTEIQGLRLHFLHLMVYDENAAGKHHYPVLLLHGWPGSVREFYSLIHKLHDSDSKYIFNVVVPSLPGYAWSQGTSKPGLGPAQVAVMMRNLMLRLGYKKFFIQGGDWGSVIGSHMATLFPENVLGYHSNMCGLLSPRALLKGIIANAFPSFFAPQGYEEFFFPLSEKFELFMEEMGHMHIQATKPDTIGSVLQNNPIGLAAYILEKFSTWTDVAHRHLPDGGLTKRFELDALLDNVMIYYLTNSIVTSQRIYREFLSPEQRSLQLDRVATDVCTGCARFKNNLLHMLDFQLKDKYTNLIHSTYYQEGGHFAAMEVPQLLYDDFIDFVQKVEKVKQISSYKGEL